MKEHVKAGLCVKALVHEPCCALAVLTFCIAEAEWQDSDTNQLGEKSENYIPFIISE